uniref:Pro-adrenomedullin n=7 Tax=Felidae TaxID=9681 RepID=A0ABI7YF66_FELCA
MRAPECRGPRAPEGRMGGREGSPSPAPSALIKLRHRSRTLSGFLVTLAGTAPALPPLVSHRGLDGGVLPVPERRLRLHLPDLGRSPPQQGLHIAAGMKLVPVALMYLGSLAFLGADTARLDVASEFRKKWNKWALSRGKRELRVSSSYPTGLTYVKAGPTQTLIRPQDVKVATHNPQASSPDAARVRVKRYRQSMNNFQGLRSFGCRFGTCTVQKLAHQIYQFTDKDKDGVAPRSKISPQGYGRRRRRSLPETGPNWTLSLEPQARAVPASSRVHQVLDTLLKI